MSACQLVHLCIDPIASQLYKEAEIQKRLQIMRI